MLKYSLIYLVSSTPAPGTEAFKPFTGSLDNKGLPVVFKTKNSIIIHSKVILHSNFIQKKCL
jgi:hypothetical protein